MPSPSTPTAPVVALDGGRWYTRAEALALLGCSLRTLRRRVQEGVVEVQRLDDGAALYRPAGTIDGTGATAGTGANLAAGTPPGTGVGTPPGAGASPAPAEVAAGATLNGTALGTPPVPTGATAPVPSPVAHPMAPAPPAALDAEELVNALIGRVLDAERRAEGLARAEERQEQLVAELAHARAQLAAAARLFWMDRARIAELERESAARAEELAELRRGVEGVASKMGAWLVRQDLQALAKK